MKNEDLITYAELAIIDGARYKILFDPKISKKDVENKIEILDREYIFSIMNSNSEDFKDVKKYIFDTRTTFYGMDFNRKMIEEIYLRKFSYQDNLVKMYDDNNILTSVNKIISTSKRTMVRDVRILAKDTAMKIEAEESFEM